MNQRIQKLAEQAHVNVITTNGMEHIVDGCYIISPNKLEKFAQLIVRECVAICQDVDGEDNIDAKSGRQDCAVEIREHFGVES
jgi:hypothetical protein